MIQRLVKTQQQAPPLPGEREGEGERYFGPQLFSNLITREYAGISGIKREAARFPPAYSHLIPPNPTSNRLMTG
jgi:hypothetical protein